MWVVCFRNFRVDRWWLWGCLSYSSCNHARLCTSLNHFYLYRGGNIPVATIMTLYVQQRRKKLFAKSNSGQGRISCLIPTNFSLSAFRKYLLKKKWWWSKMSPSSNPTSLSYCGSESTDPRVMAYMFSSVVLRLCTQQWHSNGIFGYWFQFIRISLGMLNNYSIVDDLYLLLRDGHTNKSCGYDNIL